MDQPRPGAALLAPVVAFGGTALGTLVVHLVHRAFAPQLVLALCSRPSCALDVALWSLVGGFAVLCLATLAGTVLAFRVRSVREALRTGGVVALGGTLLQALGAVLLWVLLP